MLRFLIVNFNISKSKPSDFNLLIKFLILTLLKLRFVFEGSSNLNLYTLFVTNSKSFFLKPIKGLKIFNFSL